MDNNIFEQLSDVPGLTEFQNEPAPVPMPTSVLVRSFLAMRTGQVWEDANVLSFAGCEITLHVAFPPLLSEQGMQVVVEQDGVLSMTTPLATENEESEEDEDGGGIGLLPVPDVSEGLRNEQLCLMQILPALIAATNVVRQADIPSRRKRGICLQLAHAAKHLSVNFANMQRGGE